jgi:hypothetical protein
MTSIRELKAELEELDKRRSVVVRLLDALLEYENLASSKADKPQDKPILINSARRLRARKAPVMTATYEVVREMLEEMGRPVQTQEIVRRMAEKGMDIPEDNAANVVSARLSNSDLFDGKRGKGWWFSDRPWPNEEDELL